MTLRQSKDKSREFKMKEINSPTSRKKQARKRRSSRNY